MQIAPTTLMSSLALAFWVFVAVPAKAEHLTPLINDCNAGYQEACVELYERASNECQFEGNRMSCDIARQLENASRQQQSQGGNDVGVLASGCDAGDMNACRALLPLAENACNAGNPDGCNLTGLLYQILAQQPRYGQAPPSQAYDPYQGRADQPFSYDPYEGEAFPGDPLAGNHGFLGETVGEINKYCDDPRMAAQLRAFNFCR